ncbi:Glutathione S-transferase [Melia azedarach]|uniref:Glutathione S-transferase n=1 Tax=Melia azedarach TaxID=155640 RepID=A0ACC1Y7M1_MELAZ|nr:Glutathione S-transferase [Melia azedarach]
MASLKTSNSTNAPSSLRSSPSLSFSPSLSSKKTVTLPRIGTLSHSFQVQAKLCFRYPLKKTRATRISATMATKVVKEVLPPALDSTSEPPPLFDGTARLYISETCPYVQRVWITRNCKGLQDKIKLVPINLKNRPEWYKEKVYPANKVPALEHNNEVRGESLDLIKYIDSNFEGPSLSPDDPAKKEFSEELFSYTGTFYKTVIAALKGDANDAGAAFDYFETALSKFNDGPFLVGQFSLADIAYAPFIERFQAFLSDAKQYDITAGRPKLAAWIEEMNKNEGFNRTRCNPKELVESYKRKFAGQP